MDHGVLAWFIMHMIVIENNNFHIPAVHYISSSGIYETDDRKMQKVLRYNARHLTNPN